MVRVILAILSISCLAQASNYPNSVELKLETLNHVLDCRLSAGHEDVESHVCGSRGQKCEFRTWTSKIKCRSGHEFKVIDNTIQGWYEGAYLVANLQGLCGLLSGIGPHEPKCAGISKKQVCTTSSRQEPLCVTLAGY